MSGQIELDQNTVNTLFFNLDVLKKQGANEVWKGIVKLLYQIKFLAQNKLKYDKHIVTSRLRNSIYVKTPRQEHANTPDNMPTYKDKDGKVFQSELTTVNLKEHEGAVGTNVEYGDKIEYRYDSYLYWATQNVDINKLVGDISLEKLGFKR